MDMTGKLMRDGKSIQEVFRYQPMRYYTFVFREYSEGADGSDTNIPSSVHMICVRSTGKIEFHHHLTVRDWMRFEGFDPNG
jgi:hypothetical protein